MTLQTSCFQFQALQLQCNRKDTALQTMGRIRTQFLIYFTVASIFGTGGVKQRVLLIFFFSYVTTANRLCLATTTEAKLLPTPSIQCFIIPDSAPLRHLMADVTFLVGFGGKMVSVVGLMKFNHSAVLFYLLVMVDRIQAL